MPENVQKIVHIFREEGMKKPVSVIDYCYPKTNQKPKEIGYKNVVQENEKSI